MSVFAFRVFDTTHDIAFLFVVIGKTHEVSEPQSSRKNNRKMTSLAIPLGK